MRALLITFLFLFFTISVSAQVDLDKKVDFIARNIPLQKALNKLSDRAKISIAFSDQLIPEGIRITVKYKKKRFEYILEYLLRNTGLGYKVIGDQVVLYKVLVNRKFTISGYVKDATNGERLIACHIFDPISLKGTTTNDYGFYSLTLSEGKVAIHISYLGCQTETKILNLKSNKRLDIELQPVLYLEEILVVDDDSSGLRPFAMDHLPPQMISSVPALGGEPDLFRVAQLMPGVQTGADGLGGIHIRGGSADQNLYLLDGVPIYNASHLAGIFSIYDSDAVRNTQLMKDFIPSRYGGRLSSVLDVRTKEGNNKNFKGSFGLGLTSVKGAVEGPLKKNKGAFFLSGRRALLDFVVKPITRKLKSDRNETGFSDYHFYDLNAKFNYTVSAKDQVYFSLYTGQDVFYDENQTIFSDNGGVDSFRIENKVAQNLSWGNNVGALRWNHLFNPKLFLNTTFTYSDYNFHSTGLGEELRIITDNSSQPDTLREVNYVLFHSRIRDWAIKTDFDYVAGPNHYWRFGFEGVNHSFNPGVRRSEEPGEFPGFENTASDTFNIPQITANEYSLYIEDQWTPSNRWKTNIGLRTTAFYTKGNTRWRVEPRAQVMYQAGSNWRLKSSATLMYQYLHLLSASRIGLPNDLWVPSSEQVAPQRSLQLLVGMEAKLLQGVLIGMDLYYKKMNQLVAYQEGANLRLLDARNWEEKITIGKGNSLGVEFSIQKRVGRFTSWVTYTWSKAERQFEDLNLGRPYPFRYDRRHNFQINSSYQLTNRLTVAANWSYATGLAISLPTGQYEFSVDPFLPIVAIAYNEKNSFRMPAYHRLDFDVSYKIEKKWALQQINLGVYNLYNRKNPVYYRIGRDPENFNKKRYLQATLFQILPYFSYKISFGK